MDNDVKTVHDVSTLLEWMTDHKLHGGHVEAQAINYDKPLVNNSAKDVMDEIIGEPAAFYLRAVQCLTKHLQDGPWFRVSVDDLIKPQAAFRRNTGCLQPVIEYLQKRWGRIISELRGYE